MEVRIVCVRIPSWFWYLYNEVAAWPVTRQHLDYLHHLTQVIIIQSNQKWILWKTLNTILIPKMLLEVINNVEKLDWNDIFKTIRFVPMNIIYDKVKTHSLNVCSYAVLCPFRSNREVSLGVYIDIIGCSLEPNGGMH